MFTQTKPTESRIFPTKEDVLLAITNVNSLDLGSSSIQEISEALWPIIENLIITLPPTPINTIIFRGRICQSKPTHLKEIIHPTPEFAKNYGRCNDIGQPIFYGSIESSVPTNELHVKDGQYYVEGAYITTKEMRLSHVGFTSQTEQRLASKRNLPTAHTFVKEIAKYGELNQIIYDYLADAFTREIPENKTYLYKISIAISNHLMDGECIEGLTYPSMAAKGNADNIALKPSFVNSGLRLLYTTYSKITSISNGRIFYEFLDTSDELNSDNGIIWSGRHLGYPIPDGKMSYIEVNGRSVPIDPNGERIYEKCIGQKIEKKTSFKRAFDTQNRKLEYSKTYFNKYNIHLSMDIMVMLTPVMHHTDPVWDLAHQNLMA
ncbi:hypothetical protein AQ505_08115 [Pedobacter sp. PACM 27299]|uniref:hypothetical protein n=1 Tax=Pedobacter sp. PACM 27299 TaxID=1727164 RepID=UPI000706948A|nr:hypothetical protein [Pedobacter sp. PACM 27299]ALL05459.1 hypothetical protein AQ505_08115 [Pedobacter sp. PACM 27299]